MHLLSGFAFVLAEILDEANQRPGRVRRGVALVIQELGVGLCGDGLWDFLHEFQLGVDSGDYPEFSRKGRNGC